MRGPAPEGCASTARDHIRFTEDASITLASACLPGTSGAISAPALRRASCDNDTHRAAASVRPASSSRAAQSEVLDRHSIAADVSPFAVDTGDRGVVRSLDFWRIRDLFHEGDL